MPVLLYLFIRLRLYRDKKYIASAVASVFSVFLIHQLFLPDEYSSSGRAIDLFSFYRDWVHNSPMFLILNFVFLFGYLLLRIDYKTSKRSGHVKNNKLSFIDVEVVFIMGVVSFVLVSLWNIPGGSAVYFLAPFKFMCCVAMCAVSLNVMQRYKFFKLDDTVVGS